MKPTLWYTLYKLSELGAHNRNIIISTKALAKTLETSQQTASHHLIELDKLGNITRIPSYQGMEVKITKRGIDELRKVHSRLKAIFEEPSTSITLEGKLVSGLGEGGYYISMKGYSRQFQKKLGFNPYPGTLNLKLAPSQIMVRKELETYPPVIIEGFESRRRTFGQVKCYPTTINDAVEGAVIMIDRTHYDDSVIELIAPFYLKEKLNLKEGNKVKVHVSPFRNRDKSI